MIDTGSVLEITVSIVFGGIAGFCAIMLWPRTRDPAWMLVIVGLVVNYGGLVFRALELFGVASIQIRDPLGAQVVRLVFFNLPYLLYSLGFIIKFRRRGD